MKTLKNYIQEASVLDIEGTLKQGSEVIYSIPGVKDFNKMMFGGVQVSWYCKDFIQQYLPMLKTERPIKPKHLAEVDSLKVLIFKDKTIQVLIGVGGDGLLCLHGIGDYANDGIAAEKKYVIEFFKKLAANPENFEILFKLNNKKLDELIKYHVCDNINLKKITDELFK